MEGSGKGQHPGKRVQGGWSSPEPWVPASEFAGNGKGNSMDSPCSNLGVEQNPRPCFQGWEVGAKAEKVVTSRKQV